jgi:hypothetical protein
MLRLAVAIVAVLAGCAAPSAVPLSQGIEVGAATPGISEPAPIIRATDYLAPPDARERACADNPLASRNNSFDVVTKSATTSYNCF